MIIEVSGVPCSGKTTNQLKIINILTKQYGATIDSEIYINRLVETKFNKLLNTINKRKTKKTILRVLRNLTLLIYFICSIPYYFRLHIACIKSIYSNKQGYKALRSYYFKFGKTYAVSKNLKLVNIVLMEGIVHTTQSIFVKSTSPKFNYAKIKDYISRLPLPDVLFVVYNRNKNELINRLKLRGHHRVKSSSLASENFINNAIEIEDIVLKIISEMKNNTIIIKWNGDG